MNRLITAIFTSVIFASANAALALPFRADPESFATYLNTVRWRDGKRRIFSNLSNCYQSRDEDTKQITFYTCRNAYVTIEDPLGRKICEVEQERLGFGVYSAVRYRMPNKDSEYESDRRAKFDIGNTKVCRAL
jgi:hypothetical protein